MKKTADEYDLVMKEDHIKTIGIWEAEIRGLKEKLARVLPEQYGKIDFSELYRSWDNLIPGSYAAVENGCKCPVMDNEEMSDDKKWVNADCPLHGNAQ
jgi:hypothetical protein